jgi:alkanesulfonate monooxygenase SsuD/methylene tetrahydromethanopterin reductase-like flavin-dependent oxidoreductase (luciferase family)
VLAISVANVDQMSGGRVEFGLGAGWYEQEHSAYGIPFPEVGERFDRFEEQLELIRGLWTTPSGETFNFAGRHYQLTDSPALPKPVQPHVPIIVGGRGPRRTPQLAARFADEFNAGFLSLEDFLAQRQRVIDACETNGRDPSSMTFSAALVVAIGGDETEFRQRAEAIGREPGELREHGIAGVPAEALATMQRWQDAGVQRIYLQVLDLGDLEHLDLIATEVANNA